MTFLNADNQIQQTVFYIFKTYYFYVTFKLKRRTRIFSL